MIGKRLAHYEVSALLGRGGMGEVYRARDSKLQREVAIKILPADLAGDADRLARFDREARTLATLQHPNVASAYGLEETPEARFLVMELVEGEGLDDRMNRGPIPVDEVSQIAAQIAAGLEAAHEKGIIHRDLKPANIRVSSDGTVKVLDFGLAKAWSGGDPQDDLLQSPTITAMATMEGVILGTAGYMSPEQARGRPVDKRTDIWAFGVILWEMLTGQRLFTGDTVSDVMAGVLRAEIQENALPAETPAPLRRLIRRCLERDGKRRLRDIGDAVLELDETARGEEFGESAANRSGRWSDLGRGQRLAWLSVLVVAVVASGLAILLATQGGDERAAAAPVAHFEKKSFGEQVIFNARFLPDDQGIVYSAAVYDNIPSLYVVGPAGTAPRQLGPEGTHILSVSRTGELAVLTGTRYYNHRVFEGTLARMGVEGAPRALVDAVRDADWGPTGELAIVRRVAGNDRLEYPLGKVLYETSGYISEPRVSPDGSLVAFLDHQWWLDDRGWLKLVDEEGTVTTVSEEFWAIEGVVWMPGGTDVMFSGAAEDDIKLHLRQVQIGDRQTRSVLEAPDDLTALDRNASGDLLVLSERSSHGIAARPPGGEEIDLTWEDSSWGPILTRDKKSVVFTNGRGGSNYAVAMRTTDGGPLTTLGDGDGKSLSPDGAWVAALIASPPGAVIYPLGTGAPRKLDPGAIVQFHEVFWFPDGQQVLIVGNEAGGQLRCYRQAIDGGPPEALSLTEAENYSLLTPDGTAILGQAKGSLWNLYPLDGSDPLPMSGLRAEDEIQAWSPDGKAVYVIAQRRVPCTFIRIDLATQERVPDITIGPQREAGYVWLALGDKVFDPDGGYCFGYHKRLAQLHVVKGLE